MRRKKVKWFSAPGSKPSSISLKNPERVRGERRQEAQKDRQDQGTVVRGQREKIQNGLTGDKRFKDEVGRECSIS